MSEQKHAEHKCVPDNEVVGEIKPSVYAGLRALGYCSLQRLLQQIFNEI